MKRLIAGIAIMCAAAAILTPAAAQDTIKTTDVQAQFAVGNFTTTRFDSTITTINIGKWGHSSWDFSPLKKSNAVTLTSVAFATTPYTQQFPNASHVFQANTTYFGVPATAFIYFQLGTNLLNMGNGAAAGTATRIEKNTPADVYYKLPSTYGTTWTSTYLDTTVISALGIQLGTGVWHYASYVVDAYGPMIIPGGTVHQALRIKKTDSTVSSTGTINKGVGYIYLARDGTLVTVSAVSTTGPDSGTISIYPPVTWANAVNTSVPSAASLPEKFSLEQNYPNPFNPSTVIAYAVPVRSSVRLGVYNVLGQLVAELVNGDVEAGSHSVQWHPSTATGVYLYRMDAVALDKSAATFSKVQKMAYIR